MQSRCTGSTARVILSHCRTLGSSCHGQTARFTTHPPRQAPSSQQAQGASRFSIFRDALPNRNQAAGLALLTIPIATSVYIFNHAEEWFTPGPGEFATYTIAEKLPVSSSASIFTLELPAETSTRQQEYDRAWLQGVWSIQIKQPQIQVVRSYTPLPPRQIDVKGQKDSSTHLEFLIRKEPSGEVSNWVHRLPTGSSIELRGPTIDYTLPRSVDHLVFLAGGTGIATALQAAHTHLNRDDGAPKTAHILWASRKREDCPGGQSDIEYKSKSWLGGGGGGGGVKTKLVGVGEKGEVVKMLNTLKQKHPGQVTIDYFVDEESTFIDHTVISRICSSLFSPPQQSTGAPPPKNPQILISGPDGFVSYLAGPKIWQGGKQVQGPLEGVIAKAWPPLRQNGKVWKV